MKEFLAALIIAGTIVGSHALAWVLYTFAPWLTLLLLAWVFGAIILAMLSELGITTIDLSNVKDKKSKR
jgi:hypothetical protein